MVPAKQPPLEIETDIGPLAQQASRIWFATTFYDSEGVSGIGAVGTFDITGRQYKLRYLPEIAPWSGSALLLDGNDLWIGLRRRPEGANYGAGLLRYDLATGAVSTYPVADVIFTIDRIGETLYCGSSHGLYTLRGSRLEQWCFEPDAEGKPVMVAAGFKFWLKRPISSTGEGLCHLSAALQAVSLAWRRLSVAPAVAPRRRIYRVSCNPPLRPTPSS